MDTYTHENTCNVMVRYSVSERMSQSVRYTSTHEYAWVWERRMKNSVVHWPKEQRQEKKA